MLRLYSYFRSSAAYRVRIVLNLKGLPYESVPIHLLKGDQHEASFSAKSPAHFVPVLEDGPVVLTQSLAIIEYLEELFPSPALLPWEPSNRAWVRSLALGVACDIHPLNNLRVMQYLKSGLGADQDQAGGWSRHWIRQGFDAIERMLGQSGRAGGFCYGTAPTVADCCLVPQVFNALRLKCSLEHYPAIARIYGHCMSLDAFRRAAPEAQGDSE